MIYEATSCESVEAVLLSFQWNQELCKTFKFTFPSRFMAYLRYKVSMTFCCY